MTTDLNVAEYVERRRREFKTTFETFAPMPAKGPALAAWCRHIYLMREIGLGEWTEDSRIVNARVTDSDIRYLLFIDLDETLTAENEPAKAFPSMSDEKIVDQYMAKRVPLEMRPRISALFATLAKRRDVAWFILTDNIFAAAKCTLKLAYNIDAPSGTIIDRDLRINKYEGAPKEAFIAWCIAMRRREHAPEARIAFIDNDVGHRNNVRNALAHVGTVDSLVCCDTLVTGLSEEHLQEVYRFLNRPPTTESDTAKGGSAEK